MQSPETTSVEQAIAETVVDDQTEMRERVQRGAFALDRKVPGWADKIDLDRFSLRHGDACVIGQVYGPYWDYVGRVVLANDDGSLYREAANMAFNTRSDEDEEVWDQLEEIWREEIGLRQRPRTMSGAK